ncbi:uncharacterized protein NPIL_145551 [Nephila pilipes]|uniref:Uncharacterized protein n=1 Tax=Nephila pilipes TaxID=299642 RepID=A0A8X6P1M5_NEPPI|nr:uncharacterized protein NPIL_145551 [Nephila pilipes]
MRITSKRNRGCSKKYRVFFPPVYENCIKMSKQTFSTTQYAKVVFQDSLITGIPQIILTDSIPRKILKSIVLAYCLIGFVYQTTEFLKIFWNYPTVLDIDVEYPEVIESPAITYCNLNG